MCNITDLGSLRRKKQERKRPVGVPLRRLQKQRLQLQLKRESVHFELNRHRKLRSLLKPLVKIVRSKRRILMRMEETWRVKLLMLL
jgi:hypothetical protein